MPGAFFSCTCGQVTVTFPENQGRSKVYCCCHDCYNRHEWAARQGGPPIPEKCVKKESPMWGEHWIARMNISGKDKLVFVKLHERAISTNCVADCCSTILFVDCPFYQGNVVHIFPEMINLHNSVHPDQFDFVSFVKDWPDESRANIDQSLPWWYRDEDGEFIGSDGWREAFGRVAGHMFEPAEGEGQSFADLLEECGGKVVVANR